VSGGVIPLTLNLDIIWSSVVSFTPRLPYLWEKSSRCPLDRKLHWSGTGLGAVVKRKFPSPAGNRTPVVKPYNQSVREFIALFSLQKHLTAYSCPFYSPNLGVCHGVDFKVNKIRCKNPGK